MLDEDIMSIKPLALLDLLYAMHVDIQDDYPSLAFLVCYCVLAGAVILTRHFFSSPLDCCLGV